ncbi:MAG: hypothetical protein JNJ40_12785 [Bacteroidia bacterium]|nr:hypothetical protein [Bacteroidia bacterium]
MKNQLINKRSSEYNVKQLLLILFVLLSFNVLFASANSKDSIIKIRSKGSFYLAWGYNRDWYSKSDIRFQNNNPQLINGKYYTYDFTIYDAKASDRPDFKAIKDVANITIPQFNFRIGYFFNNRTDYGIELNYDHSKYVVNDYQRVRIRGQINNEYFDKDTILNPDNFLHFEHTDGANFWMINFIKRWKVVESKDHRFNVGWIIKPGAGIVYPRTAVKLFGQYINNNWKVSGIVAGAETGFRAEFFKNGFIEFTAKGVYANYINAFVQGRGNGKASHQFWAAEALLNLGYQFNSKK